MRAYYSHASPVSTLCHWYHRKYNGNPSRGEPSITHRRCLCSLYKIESSLNRCHSSSANSSIAVTQSNPIVEMNSRVIFAAVFCCYAVLCIGAQHQEAQQSLDNLEVVPAGGIESDGAPHDRVKRTLFLKKKLLGAGLLGFGLGIAKGYKAGYHHAPEVRHVYVAPPVKYVEYVDKPVFVEKIVERPVYQSPPSYEPSWSPPEPSTSYGSPW